MRKKLLTTKEIKRYIKTHDTIEKILHCLVFFLVPFVFYLAAYFKCLFDYVDDDDELLAYLEAEKRYSAATRIWLLAIIAILLVILIVKI